MHGNHNGSSHRSHPRTPASARNSKPTNGQTPDRSSSSLSSASLVTTPPCLCADCQQQVLQWLRQYERDIETQARNKPGRNSYLTLALAKHVAEHLRRLRRMLTQRHSSIVELAKEMFEATEVNGAELKNSETSRSALDGSEAYGSEVNGSCA